MDHFIQKLHTITGCVVLLLLTLAVVNALLGFTGKKEFTSKDRKFGLFALIFTHIQFVVGLILYFTSPLGKAVLGEMKNADLRLTSMEHPLINIIAIVLITIGWSKHKRLTDSASKFKTFLIFYGLGLLLILSRIPWKLLVQYLNEIL